MCRIAKVMVCVDLRQPGTIAESCTIRCESEETPKHPAFGHFFAAHRRVWRYMSSDTAHSALLEKAETNGYDAAKSLRNVSKAGPSAPSRPPC